MLAKNLGGTVQRAKDHQFEIGFYDLQPTGDGHKIFQNQKTFFQWHKEGLYCSKSVMFLLLVKLFLNKHLIIKMQLVYNFTLR